MNAETQVPQFKRITIDANVMGGKPCIRGMRITVATLIGLMAQGHSTERILKAYPYIEAEDLKEALAFAAWRMLESEVPLSAA